MKRQHQTEILSNGPSVLAKYDAACLAIKAASEIDEVQSFISKAAAMQEYGRQINNLELQNRAALIRARAIYRLGELLKQTPRNDGWHRGTPEEPRSPKTLKEMGITKKQSATCQSFASVPESEVDSALASIATSAKEITMAAVIRMVRPRKQAAPEKTNHCTITAKNVEDTRCLNEARHRLRYCQEKVQVLTALKNDKVLGVRVRKVLKLYLQAFRDFSKFAAEGISYMEKNQ